MTEKATKADALLVTLSSSPIGSPESRAAARAYLFADDRPPDIDLIWDSKEEVLAGRDDSNRAKWGEKEFVRSTGESLEDFKKRVHDRLPVGGFPKVTEFWSEPGDELSPP
jgi:hypothetical protein